MGSWQRFRCPGCGCDMQGHSVHYCETCEVLNRQDASESAELAALRARVAELERALDTRGDIVRSAAGMASGPARDRILAAEAERDAARAEVERLRGALESLPTAIEYEASLSGSPLLARLVGLSVRARVQEALGV